MSSATDTTRGQRLALTGLFINVALAVVKLLAGLIGHSYALVADALESMTDIVGSAVIWGGLRIARKPADENHPYGHGKAESVAALIVAMMVIAAGLGIGAKSIAEIVTPHHAPAAFTLWVLIAVVLVKTTLFWIVRRAAAETGSGAVHVDAWHHVSDAITSLAAFIGISISLYRNYPPADDIAALFAAAVIVFNGLLLCRGPVRDLMDTVPSDVVGQARSIAESIPGVVNTEKVAARTHGTWYWVDMHVRVDPAMSVREAHALSHRVKDAVRDRMPRVVEVLIHIEPAPPAATPLG